MSSFDVGAIRRLAIVIGLFAGFATLHASLAPPAADGRGASVAERTSALVEPGYGHGACADGPCHVEYCPAPTSSDLDGYAVPCPAGRAG